MWISKRRTPVFPKFGTTLPGNGLQTQITTDLQIQKPSRRFWCMLKLENWHEEQLVPGKPWEVVRCCCQWSLMSLQCYPMRSESLAPGERQQKWCLPSWLIPHGKLDLSMDLDTQKPLSMEDGALDVYQVDEEEAGETSAWRKQLQSSRKSRAWVERTPFVTWPIKHFRCKEPYTARNSFKKTFLW